MRSVHYFMMVYTSTALQSILSVPLFDKSLADSHADNILHRTVLYAITALPVIMLSWISAILAKWSVSTVFRAGDVGKCTVPFSIPLALDVSEVELNAQSRRTSWERNDW